MIHRRDPWPVLVTGVILFQIILGGLGWVFLWIAKSNDELARQM